MILLVQFLHLAYQNLQSRSLIDVVHVYIADDSLLVDDKESSLGDPVRAQDPVFLGHCPMGVKVRKNRKPQFSATHAHLICPSIQGGDVIHSYAQENGVILIEELPGYIVSRPLV